MGTPISSSPVLVRTVSFTTPARAPLSTSLSGADSRAGMDSALRPYGLITTAMDCSTCSLQLREVDL